ncbi:MAG TPA: 5-formyltetrahydrofolate cyclo-ligase [Pyrinomonadaceae bacterium]|nr:5-formyltetrahydrofolate cyclo-ligase [Pyrinomonadaceae bacterium]
MQKSELRKIFLEKQTSLPKPERSAKTEQVLGRLFESFDFSQKRFLNCFVTLEKNNELDTFEIFQKIWREFPNIETTAPRINFEMNILENVRVSPDMKFVANKWQILEPEGDDFIAVEKLDVVLVPLIAFDERGFRCGYGKGFYDKFLRKCRADCQKIGLSLFPPVEKIENIEDFDVPLDFCVTPERVWKFV